MAEKKMRWNDQHDDLRIFEETDEEIFSIDDEVSIYFIYDQNLKGTILDFIGDSHIKLRLDDVLGIIIEFPIEFIEGIEKL